MQHAANWLIKMLSSSIKPFKKRKVKEKNRNMKKGVISIAILLHLFYAATAQDKKMFKEHQKQGQPSISNKSQNRERMEKLLQLSDDQKKTNASNSGGKQ